MHTVRFILAGEECNTEAEDGETILRVADSNGIPLRRGCNNGLCGLCHCIVREGIENLMHQKTGEPLARPNKVKACIAEIHGNIEVERMQ